MKKAGISLRELWLSMTVSLMVRTFYTFPRATVLVTSTAAPWAVLLAGGITLLLFWPVAHALSRRPNKNLIDLALEAGGRPLAIIVALLLGSFLISGTGIGIRQASEMAVTGFYPHTPQTFATASLILGAVLGALLDPPSLTWMGTIAALPTMVILLFVLMGNLGWGEWRNILPVTGPGVLRTAAESLRLTSFLGELTYLAIISAHVNRPQHLMKAATWSVGLSSLIGAAVVLVYVMVFPLPGGLTFPFPLLEMTRLVQGGRFLERIDVAWIWLWGLGSAGLATGALQSAALLVRDAFSLPDHRIAVLPLALTTLTVSLFPSSQADAIAIETFLIRRWGFLLTLGLPLLITLLVQLRTKARHA